MDLQKVISRCNASQIVAYLKNHPTEVNQPNPAGLTPLHLAVKDGNKALITILLQHGADTSAKDMFGHTVLHDAIRGNHTDVTKLLLKQGPRVDILYKEGHSLLHEAATNGNTSITRTLVCAKANPNALDKHGQTAMHIATSKGYGRVVKILLQNGGETNIQDECGNSLAHLAALHDHDAIIKLLHIFKADVNLRNKNGETPIFIAASFEQDHSVGVLLERGADLRLKSKVGEEPLDIAVLKKNAKTVALILETSLYTEKELNDAFLKAIKLGTAEVIQVFLEKGIDATVQDEFGDPALQLAMKFGHFEAAVSLIRLGADISAKDQDRKTPLDYVTNNVPQYLIDLLTMPSKFEPEVHFNDNTQVFLERDVPVMDVKENILDKPDGKTGAGYKGGRSALHLAAMKANADDVRDLLAGGANVNTSDDLGRTPLMDGVIASRGKTDVIEALLKGGASIGDRDNASRTAVLDAACLRGGHHVLELLLKRTDNNDVILSLDQRGRSSLHEACRRGYLGNVKVLVKKMKNVDIQDKNGHGPIHDACRKGHHEIVSELLKWGSNVDLRDNAQQTPLHKAIKCGCVETVMTLLRSGAQPNVQDVEGETPLHMAIFLGHTNIAELLLKAKADVNTRDKNGHTALHEASRRDQGENGLIDLLLLAGADVNAHDKYSKTALNFATERKHENSALVLAQAGAELTMEDLRFVKVNISSEKWVARYVDVDDEAFVITTENLEDLIEDIEEGKCQAIQRLTVVGETETDVLEALEYFHDQNIAVQDLSFFNIKGKIDITKLVDLMSEVVCMVVINCTLKGIDGMANLENLRKLSLVDCNLLTMFDLSHAKRLEVLDISHNRLQVLPRSVVDCENLRILRCNNNFLINIPPDLGKLSSALEELHLHSNRLQQLPPSLSMLTKLTVLTYHNNSIHNIPEELKGSPISELLKYLKALLSNPIPNNKVKMVLVGQEGVGKTTLVKAIRRRSWIFGEDDEVMKTDGIDITSIDIEGITLKCFDCGGDADFNETHNFFMTPQSLYIVCFNLSEYCLINFEKNSHTLGRLQLWLHYIFCKAPDSRVIIVGTHADHPSLNATLLQQIWQQVKDLLQSARTHHREYFTRGQVLCDCLLCQPAERMVRQTKHSGTAGYVILDKPNGSDRCLDTGFTDSEDESTTPKDFNPTPRLGYAALSHVMGYVEVSSLRKIGSSFLNFMTNESMENLKALILKQSKKLLVQTPTIPKLWATVLEALYDKNKQEGGQQYYITVDRVMEIYKAYDTPDKEAVRIMLLFFKTQGEILFFPHIREIRNIVILNPMWLAKKFCTLVSYRDTGLVSGFFEHSLLADLWPDLNTVEREQLLILFREFGVCLPVKKTAKEMVPCKLPIGEPDESLWPHTPPPDTKQVTFTVKFAFVPPSFFSILIARNARSFAANSDSYANMFSRYFQNHIVEFVKCSPLECQDCLGRKDHKDDEALHRIHYEFLPHLKNLLITIRGPRPCCIVDQISHILNATISWFEGMSTVELNAILCPACIIEGRHLCHEFVTTDLGMLGSSPVVCPRGHDFPSASGLINGDIPSKYSQVVSIRQNLESLDDRECPRLFVVLPINKDGLTLTERVKLWVSSVLFDGYAVHLLCEFPGGYHFTKSPGYRLNKPREFMEIYGDHVITLLQLIGIAGRTSNVPTIVEDALDMSYAVSDLIEDYRYNFPGAITVGTIADANVAMRLLEENANSFNRTRLRQFLNVMDRARCFGYLWRLVYKNKITWLCEKHYKRLNKAM